MQVITRACMCAAGENYWANLCAGKLLLRYISLGTGCGLRVMVRGGVAFQALRRGDCATDTVDVTRLNCS